MSLNEKHTLAVALKSPPVTQDGELTLIAIAQLPFFLEPTHLAEDGLTLVFMCPCSHVLIGPFPSNKHTFSAHLHSSSLPHTLFLSQGTSLTRSFMGCRQVSPSHGSRTAEGQPIDLLAQLCVDFMPQVLSVRLYIGGKRTVKVFPEWQLPGLHSSVKPPTNRHRKREQWKKSTP